MNYNRKAVEAFLRQPWSNIERNLAVDVLEWMNIAAALAGQLDATMRGIHEDRANEAALASYRSAIAEQPNPTGQGRADCGAYPGPGCSNSESNK